MTSPKPASGGPKMSGFSQPGSGESIDQDALSQMMPGATGGSSAGSSGGGAGKFGSHSALANSLQGKKPGAKGNTQSI